MSTFAPAETVCPTCGRRVVRDLATSINGSRSPEYRQAIVDGVFQRFVCPGCEQAAVAMVPFVYLDFDAGWFVGVMAEADEDRWWEGERVAAEAFRHNLGGEAPQVAQGIGAGMMVRTVFGLGGLREKLVVADAGLDETAVELLKLTLLVRDPDGYPEDGRALRVTDADAYTLCLTGHGGPHVVPRAAYDNAAGDEVLREEVAPLIAAGPYHDARRLLAPVRS